MDEERPTMAGCQARELDLRGLRCPLPALRTEKALRGMTKGARLAVLCDDPLAGLDIAHLCHEGGHTMVSSKIEAGHRRFLIEKGHIAGKGM